MTSSATARRPVIFQWEVSSRFGWGVYGLNLMLNWAQDPEVMPLTAYPYNGENVVVTPAQAELLAPLLEKSRDFQSALAMQAGRTVGMTSPVLFALGNNFQFVRSPGNTLLRGRPSVAVPFFEDVRFDDKSRATARDLFDLWIAGSTWNAQVLERAGLGPVKTIIQGIDPATFHPGPRSGRFADRFVVFSGGKLEFRKGQDLVLLAFRAFAARHPEALLLAAWHSPWPQIAATVGRNPRVVRPTLDAQSRFDARQWALANGIADGQFRDLGSVPNIAMGELLRDVDVAVFPNRAEGGTNLVAMECMACGTPIILADNTGQRDLIRDGNCFALRRQSAVVGSDAEGWGESDVEEIVEALELAWRDRAAARAIGARGAAFMHRHSWQRQMGLLKEALRPYWG